MKRISLLAGVAFVAGSLTMGQARATPVPVTVSDFETAGTFSIGDKLFTADSDDTSLALEPFNIAFNEFVFPGQEVYTVSISIPSGVTLAPGTYHFEYGVDVTNPANQLKDYSLGVDVPGGTAGVSTTMATYTADEEAGGVFIDSLSLTNGGTAGPDNSIAGRSLIYVDNAITISGTGQIISVSNTFTQQTPLPPSSPEPASIALLGSGLFALGRFRRRK